MSQLFIDSYEYHEFKDDIFLCDAPVEDAERNHIATVMRDGTGTEPETAAHIVHCVNNHDALVEALYNLASACSELIELGDFSEDGPMAHMVNNALKLAKESRL